MKVLAMSLQDGDTIVIRGEQFTVIRVYAAYRNLTEFITDDGLTRKFPDLYSFERVG